MSTQSQCHPHLLLGQSMATERQLWWSFVMHGNSMLSTKGGASLMCVRCKVCSKTLSDFRSVQNSDSSGVCMSTNNHNAYIHTCMHACMHAYITLAILAQAAFVCFLTSADDRASPLSWRCLQSCGGWCTHVRRPLESTATLELCYADT